MLNTKVGSWRARTIGRAKRGLGASISHRTFPRDRRMDAGSMVVGHESHIGAQCWAPSTALIPTTYQLHPFDSFRIASLYFVDFPSTHLTTPLRNFHSKAK